MRRVSIVCHLWSEAPTAESDPRVPSAAHSTPRDGQRKMPGKVREAGGCRQGQDLRSGREGRALGPVCPQLAA